MLCERNADPYRKVRRNTAIVFVVGGDVADPGVQPPGVVVLADDGEFGAQGGGVADGEQVRVLHLDGPVQ